MPRDSAEIISLMDAYDDAVRPPEYSDDAIALEFIAKHGEDLRYVAPWGKWLRWDGMRWCEDRTVAVFDHVRIACRKTADYVKDEKLARSLASAKTIANVERLARTDPCIAIVPEQLDADPYILNTPSGIVDLRTGQTRLHARRALLRQITTVAPADGPAPSFNAFLRDVCCHDHELAEYLHRLLGYCLTGDVRDHVLPCFYGTGANGKSTLLDVILFIMGTYAKQVPTETLMEARGDRHPTDIANLMGIRLAVSSELEEGQHWAEARIKQLTGDAVLTGRFMRQDFFEFKRTHKHVIAGNHKPAIRVVDDAMRRRIHLVPFSAKFSGARMDRSMPERLRAEAPQILTWMIAGCLEWQASGLTPPASVTMATQDYLDMQDSLGLWLEERCDTSDPTTMTRSSVLYSSFSDWKTQRGERAPSQVRFSAQMEQRFLKDKDSGNNRVFVGVTIR